MSNDAESTYRVKIETTGNPAGAQAVEKSLQGVTAAANQATGATTEHGEASKHTGSLIEELGSRSGRTRHLVEGLEQAAHGGTRGILGLARAIFSAGEAINPMTLALGAALALMPTFLEWGEKLFGSSEKIAEGAKKAAEGFAEEKSAAEKLNDANLDKFKAELSGISDEAKAADDYLKKIYDTKAKLAQAQLALDLAKIDADPSLTPEQKKSRAAAVKQSYADAGFKNESELKQGQLENAQRQAEATAQAARTAEDKAEEQRKRVEDNRRAPEDRAIVEKELLRQIADIVSKRATLGSGPDSFAQDEKLRQQQVATQEQLRYLQARDAALASPGGDRDRKAAMDKLQKDDEAAKLAKKDAEDADKKLQEALRDQDDANPARGIQRGIERHAADIAANGLPAPADRDIIERVLRGGVRVGSQNFDLNTGQNPGSRGFAPWMQQDIRDTAADARAHGADMAKALEQSLAKYLGALSPAFKAAIDDAVKKATKDLEEQIKSLRR